MKILSNEERHNVLSRAYDEIINNKADMTMAIGAAVRNEPRSVYARSQFFYNSFLPRPIRDLKLTHTHITAKWLNHLPITYMID